MVVEPKNKPDQPFEIFETSLFKRLIAPAWPVPSPMPVELLAPISVKAPEPDKAEAKLGFPSVIKVRSFAPKFCTPLILISPDPDLKVKLSSQLKARTSILAVAVDLPKTRSDHPSIINPSSVLDRLRIPTAPVPIPKELPSVACCMVSVPVPPRAANNCTSAPAFKVRFSPLIA